MEPARQYLCGLMQAVRKNMERMAEVVPESNAQALHHFLANSKWDFRAVLAQVARVADQLIGGSEDTGLLLDESAFAKKGNQSVGVARQWSGREGKVDNSQVGVFASLVQGCLASLIGVRLYLPKRWVEDPDRCLAAGIPAEEIVFKTKSELALEMVHEARAQGLRFGWIGADAGYGKEPAFLRALDQLGEMFVIDVHRSQRIYLEDPHPAVAPRRSGRGRPPSRRVAQTPFVRVDRWAAQQPDEAWQRMRVRPAAKGDIEVLFLHRRVWLWKPGESQPHHWHLLVVREMHSAERIHYALSNAPETTPGERLVHLQRQRFWIEQSIKEAKSEAGLGDYQVRGWLAWHHHMALVMMAMVFMLGERLHQKPAHPLLSCSDIEQLLAHFLPQRGSTIEEVLRQMEARHRSRLADIRSAYRKQGREPPNLEAWGWNVTK